MPTLNYQPGTYAVEIVKQKMAKARTGNPQVIISFVPYAKVNEGVPEDSPNRLQDLGGDQYERSAFWVVTDNTVDWVIDKLERIGIQNIGSWSEIDEDNPNCCDVRRRHVCMVCRHETYEGKTREKWDLRGGGGELQIEELDQNAMRELDAQFGRFLKKNATPAAAVTQPVRPEQQAPAPTEPDLAPTGTADDLAF